MGLSLSLFVFMRLLFLFPQLHLILTLSSPFMQPLCHHDESLALLQFKESFVIDKNASDAYGRIDCGKVASWTVLEGDKSDCCSWDGVECDEASGYVIGLHLRSSCLYGSINSNNSLFRLVHLQRLDLSYNHFNYSPIPPQVRNLSRLAYLNLSASMFSGQIPLEISQLSQLSSLDLSQDYSLLELKKPSLRSLVGNLTHLQELDLSGVSIISVIPTILANLSSLTFLYLDDCGLHGEFPMGIFKLPNLRVLWVGYNEGLIGHLPDFTWSSPLEALVLTATSFSGELPPSIGNLIYLNSLNVRGCNFSGFIPSTLGNLTNLTFLRLSNNTFTGEVPSSIGNLNLLSFLDLRQNQLTGPILFHLVNLMQLKDLYLQSNHFTGEIPVEILNLTGLSVLSLRGNKLRGRIPNSIFNLKNLQVLDLAMNYFSGTVEFDEFVKLKHLTILYLSYNQLSLLFKEPNVNSSFPKFQCLWLSSCNLSKFPDFLRNQDELQYLELSDNYLRGQVPEWMLNIGKASMEIFSLANNFLTGFGQHPILLPWTRLAFLDLSCNLLQGSLPIPAASNLKYYLISNNSLTGNVPEFFCNLTSLQVLDLARNSLSGSLPRCLDNFGASLSVLNLQRNKFQGSISENWVKGSQLKIIIFSQNQFRGRLPRSLVKCTMLKVLDLGNNQFNDRFPSWLKNLPNLKVLILRSNKFNGPIEISNSKYMFPNLQIIDLSYNSFVGKLPLEIFCNWTVKKFETAHHLTYIQVNSTLTSFSKTLGTYINGSFGYDYSMTMTNKGNDMFFEKVQELFTAVDMSSNRFLGEIPNSIENLKGCILLNLSNNILTGHIPPSLGKLEDLEALDLSQNKLSGEIPQELTQLNFLGFFNVSRNNLSGPIPQGKQFNTFENNSFEGNQGLCGRPLTKKCENFDELPSPSSISEGSQDYELPFEFGWKIVVIGYAFGLVLGVTIWCTVIARKHDWLMKTFIIR
ncbi:receptor-like protein 7 [Corylus avellana]|uniref:receptor-like protein 7 n=1 Tax=Corylus avellana TaxID=13451 RepID=UPI00286CFBDF|nr:receptor-like protein 7 [Corylus avellana]